MNRQLLLESIKDSFSTIIFTLCFLFFVCGEAYSQAVTISPATGSLATSPQIGSTTDIAILGVQLAKATGGANTVTAISFPMTSNPNGTLLSPRLYKSVDATFSGVGVETFIASGTLNPTSIAFSGSPLTDFGAASGVVNEFYFLVVDVDPGATGATTAIQPSVASTDVTVSTSTVGGATVTGTNYSFTAPEITIATLATGLAASPLTAGSTGKGIFGFSLTSTGTQTVSAINVQVTSTPISKWASYALIISTDASFSTSGDNSPPISGLTFTPSASQIAITGLSEIITSGTNYFLVADVALSVNASTTAVQPSLSSGDLTLDVGTATGTATGTNYAFAPLLTLTNISTGLASTPLVAGATGQGVFGFSLSSSGSQTVTVLNVQVTNGTPASKWGSYELITSTDASFSTSGDNSAPIGGLVFTPSATQIAITGLSEIITSGTNYFLVISVDPAVTSGTSTIQPSLGSSNVTVSTGGKTGTATGTTYSFDTPTATFTEITAGTAPVMGGTILSAGTTLQVLAGFSATSNGSQQISTISFNYSGLAGQFVTEYLYRSTSAGTIGAVLQTDGTPDGNFTNPILTETINSTPVYYYLVVDVAGSVNTGTASLTAAPTQANIAIVSGSKNTFSLSRTFSFISSRQSDIILNGGTTDDIPYINTRSSSMNNNGSNSVSIAILQVRDGGGSSDPDNQITRLTDLTIQLTNSAFVKKIALYDGGNEISGTEKSVSGSTVNWDLSSTPLDANDDATNNFTIRVTFQNIVTDNQPVHVTVTAASFAAATSGFAAADAGGATTSGLAAPANVIEVNASTLAFLANPPSTSINTNFSLTLRALDSQNNLDLDYGGQVDLTATGGLGTLSVQVGESLSPTLTAGVYNWTTLRITQSGTYTLSGSDDLYDDNLSNASGSVTISSSASSVTTATTTPGTICYGNSYFPLSNIVITETDPASISGSAGSQTFSIALPSGFVFDQSIVAGLGVSGGSDLSAPSAYSYPAANIVQFGFNLNGTANINTITIGGLKVGHTHPGTVSPGPTGVLSITRAGGTATITGATSGTVLGTVSASQQATAVTFTVAALAGDVTIDPNTTSFNISANAVNLVGSSTPGVFTGSGVTFVNPDYRFNPSSLAPNPYPVTYTYTDGTGCQSVEVKTLTVFTSGITNLNPTYCNNDPSSPNFTVSQTFIDQRMGPGWSLDHYVYFDLISGWVPITSPSNTKFDPSLAAYKSTLQVFGGRIPIGFAVCNPSLLPTPILCNGTSTRVAAYQWVRVNPAPNVNFLLPSNLYAYCEDNAPVTLTGIPANSNNTTLDRFDADNGQATSISHALDGLGNQVWTFSPAAVSGVTPSASTTFNITYKYTDPATACSSTFVRPITVHDRPTIVPTSDISKSPAGLPASSTTMQLCQGSAGSFSFSATDPTYTYRWYTNPLTPGTGQVGPVFNPSVSTSAASSTSFYVTRERNLCESINNPLSLSVVVVASPVAPSPNFSNATRQYCVGSTINDAHLVVPGINVKWYNSLGLAYSGSTPTAANLGLSTASATTYTFNVTQTETTNNCEGPPTVVTVTIKALPIVKISASSDPDKICTTGGTITLSAFDLADFGNPAINGTWSGAGLGGVGVLNPFPTFGTVALDPSVLGPNNYILQYSYTNSANCSNSNTINLRVLPVISPAISVGNVCDKSAAIIKNTSIVNPPTSTIDFVEWAFGDGSILPSGAASTAVDPAINNGNTTGTYLSPNHIYPNVGTFQITGLMITSDGCRYPFPVPPATIPVTVSAVPVADFTWKNVCINAVTSFKAKTNLPDVAIQSYTWNFAKNGLLNAGAGSGKNTTFTYTKAGKDTVRLIVTSTAQCQDIVDKPVYIVPMYAPINPGNSYAQDFTTNDGWISGGANSSWALGTPAGALIAGDASASPLAGNAWDTNLTGNNNPNESSWVLSGCFDFSGSVKPVISVDVWSDNPSGVDGGVLQYNLTGNIEDDIPNDPDSDGDWIVVGSVGSGVNWYNDQGISNSPGNQTTVSAGWTGRYPQWKRAIFKLDPLIGKSNVAFRMAFASSQPRGDGFAFDNIFVGERSRIILLENFTNSSTAANSTLHNAFYRNFGNGAELVKVQYHTPFPGNDPINDLNKQMHDSRAAFYGITQTPTVRLDGSFNTGFISTWLPSLYDDRVLTPAFIKLNVTAVKDGEVVKINTAIENITTQTIPLSGVHIFTTIVKKSITDPVLLGSSGNTEFVYVANQMLPSPAGITIPADLPPGQIYNAPELLWDNPNGDAIVVFVQSINGVGKNVFQAQLIDAPPLPDKVTGIEPNLGDQIRVYPNPADQSVTVELPQGFIHQTSIKMFDVNGHEMHNQPFEKGERIKVLSTHDFAGGVYLIQIKTDDTIIRRKVMVMHWQ